MLTEIEKEAFLQTAVSRDGFTLEAAKNILSFTPVLGEVNIEDVIGNLVEKSLLRTRAKKDSVRFDMLVAVEEFASLRKREVRYDLRPIVCIPWDNQDGETINAYTLGCSGRTWKD